MSSHDKDELLPFAAESTGGKPIFVGLAVIGAALLALLGSQTTPGEAGSLTDGGWWSEPALAPAVSLSILVLGAVSAYFVAARKEDRATGWGIAYGRAAFLSVWLLVAVWLIKIIGFGLSILVFTGLVGYLARFRGWKLVAVAVVAMVSMVLIFRVGFSVWFPRALIFEYLPWSSVLGRYL